MLFDLFFILLAAVLVPSSSAVPARHNIDHATLAYLHIAAVLENLDTTFYKELLAKFQPKDYINAGFKSSDIPTTELAIVQSEEAEHARILEESIISFGHTPLSCRFDVSALVADVKTATHVVRVVELLGAGAFAAAAPTIKNKLVLTTAVSIGENEAQHQSIANLLNAAKPAPGAFILAVHPQEVLAIAGSHISGCDLKVKANPSLAILNTGRINSGTKLELSSSAISGSTSSYYCQMLVGGQAHATVLPLDKCIVPEKIDGGVFVFVTKDNKALSGDVVNRKTNSATHTVIGPNVIFVDQTSDPIGKLIRTVS